MCGGSVHASVEAVEAYWDQHLDSLGLRPFSTGVTVAAYVSDGRWVADCVRCASGVACWPANPKACCLACGALYSVDYPPAAAIVKAEAVLDARAVSGQQNWRPDRGETVADLKVENLTRAVSLQAVAGR